MLVYGDPQFKVRLGCLRRHLQGILESRDLSEGNLDFWRLALIQAGQLEQGVADACAQGEDLSLLTLAEHITDGLADRFFREWTMSVVSQRHDLTRSLDDLRVADALELQVKVPEGYEFYALFPEQYAASALEWARRHFDADWQHVVVVGIRSIGTSLSALVAAVLRGVGWTAQRVTVRPQGHPFNRELNFPAREFERASFALIVDEGPGISGSSMASVAEALVNQGVAISNLVFFPGHGNEPGHAASERVREWWRRIPRFFTPIEQMTWKGKSLQDCLLSESAILMREGAGAEHEQRLMIEDITGGGWLPLHFADDKDWPPVFWPFERLKYRCVGPDGQGFLWKFSGLGALVASPVAKNSDDLRRFDDNTVYPVGVRTLPPLAGTHGFQCTRWIRGKGLRPADAEPKILREIAAYLSRTALQPLGIEETRAAVERLSTMLVRNSREQLGDVAGGRAEALVARLRTAAQLYTLSLLPACSDGRMAPHEWLRTEAGSLVKTDHSANLVDHTLIGQQPLVWDVAGIIIEWRLGPELTVSFAEPLGEQGMAWDSEVLDFYIAAYAAFKMGQSILCQQIGTSDLRCQQRMEQASNYYCSKLKMVLQREAAGSLMEMTRGPASVMDKTFTEEGSTSNRSMKSKGMPR
jgi:hypothetical protein